MIFPTVACLFVCFTLLPLLLLLLLLLMQNFKLNASLSLSLPANAVCVCRCRCLCVSRCVIVCVYLADSSNNPTNLACVCCAFICFVSVSVT